MLCSKAHNYFMRSSVCAGHQAHTCVFLTIFHEVPKCRVSMACGRCLLHMPVPFNGDKLATDHRPTESDSNLPFSQTSCVGYRPVSLYFDLQKLQQNLVCDNY